MAKLDNIIHQPFRLQIMSSLIALDTAEEVEFTYLRKILNLTDGNLGAHLAKLENLKSLGLHSTKITDAGLIYLYGLHKLEHLYLPGTCNHQ